MPSHMFDALSNPEKVCHLLSDSRIINYSAKVCRTTKILVQLVLNVHFCFISFMWYVNFCKQ